MNADEYDVIIIGCGPVGAMAANLLGQANLKSLVIEREEHSHPLPRAVHLDHEIMRLFQDVGLTRDLLPLFREAQGHIHIGADGGVIRYLGTAGLHKRFGWANDYFFFQPELENILRVGFARFPNVEALYGTSLVSLVQDLSSVTATIRSTGRTERQVRARHVIACDGASSPTRKMLGIQLLDLDFDEPWLVVDADMGGPLHFPAFKGVPHGADLQTLSVMLCDPTRPATLVPGRGSHRRWEFMLLPGETESEMVHPQTVEALLRPWIDNTQCKLIRTATYRFHGLIAENWQVGNIFLAGDAAHQTPPFFGQGMCHGMRDVANLAWKLKLVHSGVAPATLLDTYQLERDPHVRAVVTAAINAGKYICELDPGAASTRDLALRKTLGSMAPRSAGDLIPPIEAGVVREIGERFIQPRVGKTDRVMLDDATGGGFILISKSPVVLPETLKHSWKRVGGRSFVVATNPAPATNLTELEDTDGDLAEWLDSKGATAVLVRPDFYVFGTATSSHSTPKLVRDLLDQLAIADVTRMSEAAESPFRM